MNNNRRRYSLSIVAIVLLACLIIGYCLLDPKTHLRAFFGNAIADWSGSVVIILGTKFLYEAGSAESRPVKGKNRPGVAQISAPAFASDFSRGDRSALFLRLKPEGKWGQVVGNIVSEWVQMAELAFFLRNGSSKSDRKKADPSKIEGR